MDLAFLLTHLVSSTRHCDRKVGIHDFSELTFLARARLLVDVDDLPQQFTEIGRELEAANAYRSSVIERLQEAVRENERRGREVSIQEILRRTHVARQTVYDAINAQDGPGPL